MEDQAEIMIAPERVVKLTASPRDLFTVLAALQDRGYTPQVRTIDKEIGGWTCWMGCEQEKPSPIPPKKKKRAA